ncbi:MAG: biopolymer transporter ExbD [Gammaproteobacteria bacterium]|nr:biopolymer transporter ExbD [Gammaproteobacteria bacterium]MDH3507050.1 biopolymer transporter ExbD [Gammaproteobacteria bacterium]
MRSSGRAARMDRHHKRHKRNVALNLVSLMDIFTILVFFLLVNSSEVQTLPNARDLELPESIAEQRPRETVVVMVTDSDLLVQGRSVALIADITSRNELIIPELKAELQRQSERMLRQSTQDDPLEREVTIMGDKEIPYSLLRRVMATATDADYGRLSLAVAQTTSDLRLAAFNSAGQ